MPSIQREVREIQTCIQDAFSERFNDVGTSQLASAAEIIRKDRDENTQTRPSSPSDLSSRVMQQAIQTLSRSLDPSLSRYPKLIADFPGRMGVWRAATMEKVGDFIQEQADRISKLVAYKQKHPNEFRKAFDALSHDEQTFMLYAMNVHQHTQQEAELREQRASLIQSVLQPGLSEHHQAMFDAGNENL